MYAHVDLGIFPVLLSLLNKFLKYHHFLYLPEIKHSMKFKHFEDQTIYISDSNVNIIQQIQNLKFYTDQAYRFENESHREVLCQSFLVSRLTNGCIRSCQVLCFVKTCSQLKLHDKLVLISVFGLIKTKTFQL